MAALSDIWFSPPDAGPGGAVADVFLDAAGPVQEFYSQIIGPLKLSAPHRELRCFVDRSPEQAGVHMHVRTDMDHRLDGFDFITVDLPDGVDRLFSAARAELVATVIHTALMAKGSYAAGI